MKKRLLSAFLVLAMVLTLLPSAAFATEPPAPGTKELQPGEVEAWKTAEYNEETGDVEITLHIRGKDVETSSTTANALNVVMVVDNSSSMLDGAGECTSTSYTKHNAWFGNYWTCDTCGEVYYWTDPGHQDCRGKISKMSAAKSAAKTLVNALAEANPNNEVGIVSFQSDVVTDASTGLTTLNADGIAKLNGTIDKMDPPWIGAGTNYDEGLSKAQEYLWNCKENTYVIFISDGEPDPSWANGRDEANALKAKGTKIYTIGLGLKTNAEKLMGELASPYDPKEEIGYSYNFTNLDSINTELSALVQEIAYKISKDQLAAGTDVTFTDVVADGFTVKESSDVTVQGQTVTWHVETITEEPQTVTFTVIPEEGTAGSNVATNASASVTYTDSQNSKQTNDNIASAVVTIPYTVKYDANGGTLGTGAMPSYKVQPGSTHKVVSVNDMTKDGCIFVGWSKTKTDVINAHDTKPEVTNPGTELTIDGNTTLYAVWAVNGNGNDKPDYAESYKVSYKWDGEAPDEAQLPAEVTGLKPGDQYTVDPTYSAGHEVEDSEGNTYTFSGWTDPGQGKIYDRNVVITGTWTKTEVDTLYLSFYESDGWTQINSTYLTVTSADPTKEITPPAATVPGGMKFVGWKLALNNTQLYYGKFDYASLSKFVEEGGSKYISFVAEVVADTREVPVKFMDESTREYVDGGGGTTSVTVPASSDTELALSGLTLPEGYVLSDSNPNPYIVRPTTEEITIFVKQDRTITIYYNISDPSQGYLTQAPGKMFYHETFPEAKSGLYSLEGVTAAPGYTFTGWSYNGEDSGILPAAATLADVLQHVVWNGAEGFITVSPIFERITRDVTVRFVDKATGEAVGDSYTMAVAPDANNVSTSDIDSSWIPEGYELAEQGDLMIDNDVVTVPVRRIAPTDAELKALLWNLQVDCTTEGHEPITTGLLDGSYTVTGDGLGVQGDYYYIQLNTAPYVAAYDAYSETHTGVDGSTMTIVLYHDDIKWIVPDTLMVRLNCERAVYNTIHVSFVNYVDGKDVSLGGGDVISTAPSVKLETPAPSGFTPEGKTFVGWKVRLGNSPMYEGEFTYDALYALMQEHGQDFYENQAWLTFEPVFADDYRVIHLKFVDEDENVIGSGDVISTYPDQEYDLPDPAPFAPEGQSFVGWKVWVNGEPMYDGKFTFSALSQLLDSGFYGDEAWLTFQAVYADDYRVIHLKFVDEDENVIGSGDVISTYPDQEYILPDPAPFAPEGQSFVGWKVPTTTASSTSSSWTRTRTSSVLAT